MALPHKPAFDLDDDDLELPPALGRVRDQAREEESWQPDQDDDLGLGDDDDQDGLDAVDTGLEESGEGDLIDGEEDEESWLDDGTPRDDASLSDDDFEEDEADDQLAGDGPDDALQEEWEDDPLELDEPPSPSGDGGEEGFDDEGGPLGLDLDRLPPLDDGSGGDADNEAFAAELLEALSGDLARDDDDEAQLELAPGLRGARLPAAQVRLEPVLQLGHPLQALLAAGEVGVGWDAGLLLLPSDASRALRAQPGGSGLLALAAAQAGDTFLIACATPEGVCCSLDGGRSFAPPRQPQGEHSPVASLAITGEPGALRLWAATPAGALFASDDLGGSFRRVRDGLRALRLASDGQRDLILLGRAAEGGARALRSRDGGDSFEPLALGDAELERVQALHACAGVALCSRRAPSPQLLWQRGDAPFVALPEPAAPPAALLDQDGVVYAYFCLARPAGALLLRRALGAQAGPLQAVAELPGSAGAPLQLAGCHRQGRTTLQIGTERGWYRVSLHPDGAGRV